jgi:hypothetical protein
MNKIKKKKKKKSMMTLLCGLDPHMISVAKHPKGHSSVNLGLRLHPGLAHHSGSQYGGGERISEEMMNHGA